MKKDAWLEKNTESLSGKCVAVSGATGGIGRELCFALASLGASLILINRSIAKATALEVELRKDFPELDVYHVVADFEDMESVRDAVRRLYGMPIDYLILNAGAYSIPRKICDSGCDNVFQINFVSPYYMAKKLMPNITERGGRIIAVGSIAHNYSKINTKDIDFRNKKQASLVYGNAKRYLTYALLDEFGDTERVAIAHPGITFTNITAHYPKLIFAIIKHPMKIIFMKPKAAARSIIRGIFEPTVKYEWIGPSIFNVWGNPKKKKLRTASSDEIDAISKIAAKIYRYIE